MFDNIGKKVKRIADRFFALVLMVSFVDLIVQTKGIVLMIVEYGDWTVLVHRVVEWILVDFFAWVLACMLCAFGELVEQACEIKKLLCKSGEEIAQQKTEIERCTDSPAGAGGWSCGACGRENPHYTTTCLGCGEHK